jgi:signal transduction histidine kinase
LNTKKAVINMLDDLKEANENLKQLDKSKSEFLNIVSHELKTPLTAIIAHLDVLDDLKKNLTPQELSSFEAIRRNTDQLRILISNILEISRIESGKFELAVTKVNLKEMINSIVEELKILAKQKNIELKSEVGSIPLIEGDDTRIHEIINNLVSNATKFTEKGEIKIKAEKKGKFIEVSVSDTGIGIPPDKMKNLFQKFYQVDPSIGRRYGGTGLGLSITKKMVEMHHGTISVSSTLGKGSTFKFTLPVNQTDINSKRRSI